MGNMSGVGVCTLEEIVLVSGSVGRRVVQVLYTGLNTQHVRRIYTSMATSALLCRSIFMPSLSEKRGLFFLGIMSASGGTLVFDRSIDG